MALAREQSRSGRAAILLVGLVLLSGCSFPDVAAEATPTPAAQSPTEVLAVLPSATPEVVAPSTLTQPTSGGPGEAASQVSLAASGGNLTVRRGPAPAYNPVSYMQDGQSGSATGRNQAGDWLFVDRPEDAGRDGWVFLSSYASVTGDAASLPVLPAETAGPAYLRNCTYHPMMIQPGGFLLVEMFDAPNNMRQVNPGAYQAFDQNVEGEPQVFSGEIREGQTIDIETDGLNNTYGCS
ncbi:MAG: hypothetical protein A2Y93_12340 [Chloroflexi bacterium RBG_13_68_17]|nr:MAG: hypothetical protein A2Y93_12340 [Chloroflexi bacterium RBG_13_68_17]